MLLLTSCVMRWNFTMIIALNESQYKSLTRMHVLSVRLDDKHSIFLQFNNALDLICLQYKNEVNRHDVVLHLPCLTGEHHGDPD